MPTHTGEDETMSDAVDEGFEPGREYAQAGNPTSVQGRSGTDAIREPLPGQRQLDAYISADREAQRLKAEEKRQEEGRTTEPPPGSREYRAAWEIARRLELEESKGSTTEPPPGTEEHEAAKAQVPGILADEASRSPGESIFKDIATNDPAIEKAFERWPGVYVVLRNGERIADPKSPTGYVMAPFNDLASVAAAGREVKRELEARFAATASPAEAEKRGRELVKEYLGQGGAFDYQRRHSDYGKDGFTQLRQFRNIANINVGLFCQQTSFLPKEKVLQIAGEYARENSSNYYPNEPYGLDPETRKYIEIGYRIGEKGLFNPPRTRARPRLAPAPTPESEAGTDDDQSQNR